MCDIKSNRSSSALFLPISRSRASSSSSASTARCSSSAAGVAALPFHSSRCLLSWNCRSLNEAHLAELSLFTAAFHPLVVAVCETKRDPACRPPRLLNYIWYGHDVSAGTGGVGLFIHHRLPSSIRRDLCPHPSSPSALPSPQ